MKKIAYKSISIIFFCIFGLPYYAYAEGEFIPDYYEEAGMPDARDLLNQNANEYIDPFSGTLNLQHVDLEVPGNGGLDIKIQRSYANIHDAQVGALGLRTPYGVGWTMHFGRVIKSGVTPQDRDVCSTLSAINSSENPILELPDGSRQILFNADVGAGSSSNLYITKQRWKAVCRVYTNGSGTQNGLEVWSPEGLKYEMAWLNSGPSSNVLYVTRITDRNGNYININYENIGATGYTLIKKITSKDGRLIIYSYTDRTNNRVQLNTITANNQTWAYGYNLVPGVGTDHYYLTSVRRPDATTWAYRYKSTSGAGQYSIDRITYPTRGAINYSYRYEYFGPVGDSRATTSINRKTTSDSGTWTYNYTPGSFYDRTNITTPNGAIEYRHFGARAAAGTNSLWKVGLLLEKRIGSGQVETYSWGGQLISYENYTRPTRILGNAFDTEIYVPILTKKIIRRDGTNYTTSYSNYDGYGNAQRINETGNAALTRTNTYYTNESKWIIHELDKETLSGISGTIDRTFDSYGNLKSINRYGAITAYTYTTEGDLRTLKDPELKTMTYSGYMRGIAEMESQPEAIKITRNINLTGTIDWVRNGEGKTTYFGYDRLNRVDFINRPINSDASITYAATRRTFTRGAYSETVDYDGFGRPTRITKVGGDTSYVNIRYNPLGQKTFESYPNSNLGITYGYDALGRIKTTSFYGGGTITYSYSSANRVTVNDQRGKVTTYTYRSFGDPDAKDLMKIQSPESITTSITRNNLGQIKSVSQGGKTRSYYYNTKYYLDQVVNPETGTTIYGRDNVGNMTSRRVGASGITTFVYDNQHRLFHISYPGTGTPTVKLSYDKNNNVKTVGTGTALRQYNYDDNDNLVSETLTIGTQQYPLTYGISTSDHLDSVTYPSGRKVSYYTNAKGRPTQVSPYITNVSYHPNGQPNYINYANGVTTSMTVNSRQWLNGISSPISGEPINLSYTYDYNGNVERVNDNNDSNYTRVLTYDGVNRLKTASGIWGFGSISYDTGGNIRVMNVGGRNITYHYNFSSNRLTSTTGGLNYSLAYDVYGNIKGNGVNSFTYDEASNLTQVRGFAAADFQYDGNQTLVTKTRDGTTTHLLYNKAGELFGEYMSTGQWLKEYAYLSGKLVTVTENLAVIPPNISVPPVDYDGSYAVSWSETDSTITGYKLYESTSPDVSTAALIYQGLSLSASLSGKSNGVYYYWVRACVNAQCGMYSTNSNSVSVELPAGVPSSITVPALDTDGSFTISWGSAIGEITHYELYESTDNTFSSQTLIASSPSLTATLSNRGSNRYYYRVRACYKTNCSAYRKGLNSLQVNIPIGIPAGVTVPAIDQDGAYDITWGNSTGGPTYYQLYEATNSRFNDEVLVTQGLTNSASVSGRENGIYFYRVRGCSAFTCSDFAQPSIGVLVNLQPPTAPVSVTVPIENYSGTYSISWGAAVGEIVRYEVYESTDVTFASQVLVFQGLGSSTFLTGKATANITYYYRVRACSAILCSSYTAANSGVVVRIAPSVPGTMSWPGTDDDGRYTISWGAATGQLTHYKLVEDIVKNFPKPKSQTTSNTSVAISGKDNGSYIYQVRACNGQACSGYLSSGFVVVGIPADAPSYINVPSADYSGAYTVDWGAVSIPFTRYELFEATSDDFSGEQLVYSGTSRSFVLNKQTDGTFYYRVRACNGSSCYGYRTGENNMTETIVSIRAALMSIITNLLLN